MPENITNPKRARGRPPVRVMPEPIPDTPENLVRALCQGPPKPNGKWKFMKPGGAGYVTPILPARRRPEPMTPELQTVINDE